MGWLYQNKPSTQTTVEYFEKGLSFDDETYTQRVLKIAQVRMSVVYAAVERITKATGKREVWAFVALVRYVPNSTYNFGYKDMDETVGPCECDCPESILDLLTPTEFEYAIEWRKKCRARIAMMKTIHKGCVLTFAEPIKFNSGFTAAQFTVVHAGRGWLRAIGDPMLCRVSRDLLLTGTVAAPVA